MQARAGLRPLGQHSWCVLALAAALLARPAAVRAEGAQLLVWSTAPGAEAGEAELARLRQLLRPLSPVWQAPGAAVVPAVAAAAAGAPKGAFLVIAGACEGEAAGRALQILKALRPEAAARPLTPEAAAALGAPPCPAAPSEAPDWRPGPPARGTRGALAFVGFPFGRGGTEGALGTSRAGLRVIFVLLDPRRRTLLDSAEYRPPGEAAVLRSLAVSARGLALRVEYADPACEGEAERYVPWRAEITAAADGQRLHLEDSALTRLREVPCGAAASPEGAAGEGTGARTERAPAPDAAPDELIALPE